MPSSPKADRHAGLVVPALSAAGAIACLLWLNASGDLPLAIALRLLPPAWTAIWLVWGCERLERPTWQVCLVLAGVSGYGVLIESPGAVAAAGLACALILGQGDLRNSMLAGACGVLVLVMGVPLLGTLVVAGYVLFGDDPVALGGAVPPAALLAIVPVLSIVDWVWSDRTTVDEGVPWDRPARWAGWITIALAWALALIEGQTLGLYD